MSMEGVIIGFDEYMNLVLDDAVEIIDGGNSNNKNSASKVSKRTPVGRCLLKGDSVTLMQ